MEYSIFFSNRLKILISLIIIFYRDSVSANNVTVLPKESFILRSAVNTTTTTASPVTVSTTTTASTTSTTTTAKPSSANQLNSLSTLITILVSCFSIIFVCEVELY